MDFKSIVDRNPKNPPKLKRVGELDTGPSNMYPNRKTNVEAFNAGPKSLKKKKPLGFM